MMRQSRSRNENKLNGGFVSNCYLNGIKMQGFEFESLLCLYNVCNMIWNWHMQTLTSTKYYVRYIYACNVIDTHSRIITHMIALSFQHVHVHIQGWLAYKTYGLNCTVLCCGLYNLYSFQFKSNCYLFLQSLLHYGKFVNVM